MHYPIGKYLSILALSILGAGALNAQETETETINQDVRVIREYNPTISNAFKINEMPEQSDTMKANPVFRYQLTGKAIVTPPEMVPLVPAKMAREPREELYPSYVAGYLGNYEVFGGQILYNLVQNERFALALKAGHETSFGDLELEDKREVEAPYHETQAGLYLRHFFKKKTLSLDLDFNNNVYKYYGLQTINPEGIYLDPTPLPEISAIQTVQGSALIPDSKQRQTAFDIALGFLNQETGNDAIKYKADFGFSTFGNLSGVKENQINLGGELAIPFGELAFNLEAGVEQASTKLGSNDHPELFLFTQRQQSLVYANPSLVKQINELRLKMGLRIAGEFDDMGDEFYLSPDLQASVVVAEGVISLEGGITGDVKSSTYRGIMAENPFVAPDVNVKTAFHTVRFYAGVRGNFSNATSFAARMDYSVFQDEHFYINRMFDESALSVQHYSNLFDVAYDDGRLLTVSGEFKVKPIEELDVVLRGAYYGWDLDLMQKAWHKPDMELGLRAAYQVNRDLTLTTALNILGERYAPMPEAVKKLDSVVDFNLGANYTLNKRWNFFGNIQNLFAAKYYRFQGYPMQGVNFRVGVGYSF